MKLLFYIILALAVILAFILAEWNGIWIVEGVLLGIGMAVAKLIQDKEKDA